jgi:hypothetical protein
MDEIIKSIYRLALKGYPLKSKDVCKFREIEVFIPNNHASSLEGYYDKGWNVVASLDTLNPEDRIEEDKREERWKEIVHVYRMVLKNEWYVSVFHDKFDPTHMCFMLRDESCNTRYIARLPL